MKNLTTAKPKPKLAATDDLFTATVDVANEAIAVSEKDDQVDSMAEDLATDRDYNVAVFNADPLNPEGYYQLHFNGHALESAVARDDDGDVDVSCKICKEHLQEVCDDPEDFIENPAKLDLVWLLSRMAA